MICVGLNYADHAADSRMALPDEPVLFMKATTSIIGSNDHVVIPRGSRKTDWEVEYLKPGAVMELGIEGLGRQRQQGAPIAAAEFADLLRQQLRANSDRK
jgi:2-keto-4-pentenoate hydratase/2-oxohepta-3-ene-1,7-dioic acid hydratase in catechol pathway